jgi:hypothetical protein
MYKQWPVYYRFIKLIIINMSCIVHTSFDKYRFIVVKNFLELENRHIPKTKLDGMPSKFDNLIASIQPKCTKYSVNPVILSSCVNNYELGTTPFKTSTHIFD